MVTRQRRALYVLHSIMREYISALLVASDAKQSGTSSQSRASIHIHIRDFQQHDISTTIYFLGIEYGTKSAYILQYHRYR